MARKRDTENSWPELGVHTWVLAQLRFVLGSLTRKIVGNLYLRQVVSRQSVSVSIKIVPDIGQDTMKRELRVNDLLCTGLEV